MADQNMLEAALDGILEDEKTCTRRTRKRTNHVDFQDDSKAKKKKRSRRKTDAEIISHHVIDEQQTAGAGADGAEQHCGEITAVVPHMKEENFENISDHEIEQTEYYSCDDFLTIDHTPISQLFAADTLEQECESNEVQIPPSKKEEAEETNLPRDNGFSITFRGGEEMIDPVINQLSDLHRDVIQEEMRAWNNIMEELLRKVTKISDIIDDTKILLANHLE